MDRVAVIGIGKSGLAAARWALSQGLEVLLSDQMPETRWAPDVLSWCKKNGVEMDPGGHNKEKILSAECIIPSPGVPLTIPVLQEARKQGIPIWGELAIALSLWKGPVVGVTGTNGKTTVTTLIGTMLRESGIDALVAGNIGTPVLDRLDQAGPDTVLVLEVSSFQLDLFPEGRKKWPFEKPPRFNVAVLLNIAQDHLDRYKTFEAYAMSKARIFAFQEPNDWAVIQPEEIPLLARFNAQPRARRILNRPALRGNGLLVSWPEGGHEGYNLSSWQLSGGHNIKNLYASIVSSRLMGARESSVQRTIDTFKAPPSRLEVVRTVNGVAFVNDSKATNCHATLAAVSAIKGPVILIAGGRGKGQDFGVLSRLKDSGKVIAAVLMGEDQEGLKKALDGIPLFLVDSRGNGWENMRKAVDIAFQQSREGTTILLSPACASFDLYSGYEERAEAFRDAVRNI